MSYSPSKTRKNPIIAFCFDVVTNKLESLNIRKRKQIESKTSWEKPHVRIVPDDRQTDFKSFVTVQQLKKNFKINLKLIN